MRRLAPLLCVGVMLVGCSKPDVLKVPRLSSSEEFRLRGECAGLGKGIVKDHSLPGFGIPDVVSNFKMQESRCYVTTAYRSSDQTHDTLLVQLWDGQTAQYLASYGHYTKDGETKTFGRFFEPNSTDLTNQKDGGLAAAKSFVDSEMQRDTQ